MSPLLLVAVGFGGALGALCRSKATGFLKARTHGDFPAATLIINICSCTSWTLSNVAGVLIGGALGIPLAIASFAMTSIFICLLVTQKITFENDLYIDSSNKESASMSLDTLETQMSGGTINTIIGDDSALRSQHLLGYLEPLDNVLTSYQMGKLRERGALVTDGEGGAAKAIDLGKSAEWTRIKGQDPHAQLSFVNVQNKDYARLFVDYLFGM